MHLRVETMITLLMLDLCDWLLMHTKCESISLSSALESVYDYRSAFFFTMHDGESFDSELHAISEKGDINVVVKYLID